MTNALFLRQQRILPAGRQIKRDIKHIGWKNKLVEEDSAGTRDFVLTCWLMEDQYVALWPLLLFTAYFIN